MKHAARVLICALTLCLTPTASAVMLISPTGAPVGGKWQRWADQAKVPTIRGPLIFELNSSPCGLALGCSALPAYGTTMETWMSPNATPYTLYSELGHQFDWRYLTPALRGWFARAWHPHRPDRWFDTTRGLDVGVEDGLDAVFAAAYAYCAMGLRGASVVAIVVPIGFVAPSAALPADTCKAIAHIPRRTRRQFS